MPHRHDAGWLSFRALSAALLLGVAGSAALGAGAFSLTVASFGEGGAGSPYTTSDGSAFFVHSAQDFGDGTPGLARPIHTAITADAEIEWTTYFTHDAAGPTRRSGGVPNAADQFYLDAGVYPAGFASRSASLVSFTPGLGGSSARARAARESVVATGSISGASFMVGPAIESGISPLAGAEGIFLARLTVQHGITVHGAARLFVSDASGQTAAVDVTLDGSASGGLALRSFLVAQTTIADTGFDGSAAFGDADVYDIWAVTSVPAPCTPIALLGAAAFSRRRRG